MSHPPARPERIPHLTRILAGAAIAAAALLHLRAGFSLFLVVPVIAGALVPLLRSTRIVTLAEGIEAWVRRRHERTDEGGVARTLASPFLRGAVWGMDRTDRVTDDYVRSGIRAGIIALALGALLLAAWFVAIAVFYIALVVFAIGILFFMVKESLTGDAGSTSSGSASGSGSGSASGGGSADIEAAPAPRNAAAAGLRGKRLVNTGFLVDVSTNLAIDDEGYICEEGFLTTRTGYRIDEDGNILKTGFMDSRTGLRIAPDGRIMKSGFLLDEPTGTKIRTDGRVMKEAFLFDIDTGSRFK